jgi:hypothetical protein
LLGLHPLALQEVTQNQTFQAIRKNDDWRGQALSHADR